MYDRDIPTALKKAKDEGSLEGKAEESDSTIQRMKACGFTEELILAIYSDFQ